MDKSDDDIRIYDNEMSISSKVKHRFDHFAQNSSVTGLSHMYNARSWCRRSTWVILLLVCWIGTAYQIYLVINEYFQYPVLVTTTEVYDSDGGFPFVSICSLNPIKYSKMDEMYSKTRLDEIGETISKQKELDIVDLENKFYYDLFENQVDTKQLGHALDDMLLEATFKAHKLNSSNFITWDHPIYGKCYTFSTATIDSSDANTANLIGPFNGLNVLLATQTHEYFNAIAKKAGFRVLVSRNVSLPYPEMRGFDVSPFTETEVIIQSRLFSQKPSPYSDCYENIDEDGNYVSMERGGELFQSLWNRDFQNMLSYDKHACEVNCEQQIVFKHCNCVDAQRVHHTARNFTWNTSNSGVRYAAKACDYGSDGFHSKRETAGNEIASVCAKECSSECYNFEVWSLVTTSALASEANIDTYKDTWIEYIKQFDGRDGLLASHLVKTMRTKGLKYQDLSASSSLDELLTDREIVYEAVKMNVLRLRIFYASLTYISVVENPEHTWSSVLVDIGGILGLWIGLCAVTLIEVAELCVDLCLLNSRKYDD